MSNWQNWAVALILLLCIVRIGQRVYAFFMKVKEKRNPCENCATGCELKQLYEKKRSECSDGKKEIKKKMLLIVGSFKKMTTFATANEKDWFLG